jgi:ABC-type transporter Mla subunit MlaD
MAVSRAQRVRLGIFVAAGLTVLIGGLLVLAGMKLGERRDEYIVRFTDADVSLNGLEVGSQVKYSGIRVGRVEAIRVDPNDVAVIQVVLSLDGGTPIAEDSKANLGSMGITGLKYVELTRGTKGARLRKPGETIPAGASFLDDLTAQAGAIAGKANEALDHLAAFTGPDMKDRVAKLLDHADQLLVTVNGTLDDNRAHARDLIERLSGATGQLETLARELTGTVQRANALLDKAGPHALKLLDGGAALMSDLRGTRGRVDGALDASTAVLSDLHRTLSSADKLLDRSQLLLVQSREEIVEAVKHLRDTAENMSVLSQRVRDDPSLLLLGGSGQEDPQ